MADKKCRNKDKDSETVDSGLEKNGKSTPVVEAGEDNVNADDRADAETVSKPKRGSPSNWSTRNSRKSKTGLTPNRSNQDSRKPKTGSTSNQSSQDSTIPKSDSPLNPLPQDLIKPKSGLKRSAPKVLGPPSIEKDAEFTSFLQLRDALEKYQKKNSVQLVVKDSKLLSAGSTKKIIPKVYHIVNQKLMYHSITYACKCHGELKQKPGTRTYNVGRRRLNCPMYIRFRLSADCKRLVLFDIFEEHNHEIDRNTCQLAPRQQVYQLSRLKRKRLCGDDEESELNLSEADDLVSRENSKPDGNGGEFSQKLERLQPEGSPVHFESKDSENDIRKGADQTPSQRAARPESPLDSSSSTCSDSDEEEFRNNRRLLPYPIRLIGAAITSNPELIASTKELLEIQKSKMNLEKQKLVMETKILELSNTKLELEVRQLRRILSSEFNQTHDTTIYVQAP